MPGRIVYRRQLLRAVEAFLEGTASSREHGQRIVGRCEKAIHAQARLLTLDQIIWSGFIQALTDSVYSQSLEYLREVREILHGHAPQHVGRVGFHQDFRGTFTADEAEWYTQLVSCREFLSAVPFADIHEATFAAWQNQDLRATMHATIPEAALAEELETEYQRRKAAIEKVAARCPSPEQMGDETISHLVLREVSSVLTSLSVGRAAVTCGYPILDAPYTAYGESTLLAPGIEMYVFNMSERLRWARQLLAALRGEGELLLSWRLSQARTCDADVLVVSLY